MAGKKNRPVDNRAKSWTKTMTDKHMAAVLANVSKIGDQPRERTER